MNKTKKNKIILQLHFKTSRLYVKQNLMESIK